MPSALGLLFLLIVGSLRSRRDLILENLSLRQRLTVLSRRRPQPRFSASDRLFWIALRRLWPEWRKALILIEPDTVMRWHRNWIQAVLEVDFTKTCRRWKEGDERRTARADFSHGSGESHLGRASNPWRTQNAGLPYFGTNCASVDEESSQRYRASKAMGYVPEQPS
jgi:hypothetical protein